MSGIFELPLVGANLNDFDHTDAVRPAGRVMFDVDTGTARAFDGVTPGGALITDWRSTGIDIEFFGATGQAGVDDGPAIRAAIACAEANDIRVINFRAGRYEAWSTVRKNAVQGLSGGGGNFHFEDGEAIVVRTPMTFRSLHPGGTTIVRRHQDGRSFSEAGAWQVVAGAIPAIDGPQCMFRGAGIYVRGLTKAQLDAGVPRPDITLIDMTLDAELPWSLAMEPDKHAIDPATGVAGDGKGAYPARLSGPFVGLGWDCLNRGIYFEEDMFGGSLTMIRSTITGFRGEMVRQGYGGVIIADTCTFSICGADLINPSGAYTILTNCTFDTAFAAWEGWFGAGGRMSKCLFRNCYQGASRLQGGTYNGNGPGPEVPGGYYIATRLTADELPYADIDATFINCGTILVGSWIRGVLHTTDTIVSFTSYSQHDVVQDVDLTIYATIDQNAGINGFAPVTFYDQDCAPGSKVFQNIRVTVFAMSSTAALAANPPRRFQVSVSYRGSIGDNVVVEGGGAITTRPAGANGPVPDNKLSFRQNAFKTATVDYTGSYADISGGNAIEPTGERYLVYVQGVTGTSVTALKISTTGYQDGHEVRIIYDPGQPVGAKLTLDGTGGGGSGMLLNAASRTLTRGQEIALRYSAAQAAWVEQGYYPYGGAAA